MHLIYKRQEMCPNGHFHSIMTAMKSAHSNKYLCPDCSAEMFKDFTEYLDDREKDESPSD